MAKTSTDNKNKEKYSGGFTDVSGRDGYYRPKIEVGRWALGSEILRSNFAKLVGFNIFMLIFVAPIVALVLFRAAALSQAVSNSPFAANLSLGFQPNPNMFALSERLEFAATWRYFIYMPLAVIWLGLGLSGGMYVMRNLAWGEKVRVYKAFLTGIKRNALTILVVSLVYGLILTSALMTFYYVRYLAAFNGAAWYYTLSQVLLVIVAVFSTLWYLMMVSMGVTYRSGVFALMKNSLLITTVLLPLNVFFAVFGALAFALLLMGVTMRLLAILLVMLLGVSFFMLVWTVYSQWVFDKFINPNIKQKYVPTEDEVNAKKIRDKIEKQAERSDGFVTVGEGVMGELGAIKPISEGSAEMVKFNGYYTRKDIAKSSAVKVKMAEENDKADKG